MRAFALVPILVALAGTALAASPATLAAQSDGPMTAETISIALPVVARTPITALDSARAALHSLVVAQETYFAERGTYTTDLVALREFGRLRSHPGIAFNVAYAGGTAWRGSATPTSLLGKSCVVYAGAHDAFPLVATRAERRRPTEKQEGQPVCDAP
jgi:hypothetical protein